MKGREGRRERLHKLLDLARLYRGWSRSQLARALNRDVSSIYTSSDDPKVSLVMALADVLEWPVDTVVEFIFCGIETGLTEQPADPGGGEFAEAYEAANDAYRTGKYRDALNMSRKLLALARDPVSRARGHNIEFLAWDGMGRFTKAKRAIQQALFQTPLPIDYRLILLGNLANAHYSLWELEAAFGIASRILDWYAGNPATTHKQRISRAYALYVAGHALRRQLVLEPEQTAYHAQRARDYLASAAEVFAQLGSELDRPDLGAVAHTCRGGLLEAEVALGVRAPIPAIKKIENELTPVSGDTEWPTGPWLESYGWWCVFGANVALRHTSNGELQHYMAIFTEKALEIADRADHWAFRERVLTFEYQLRKKVKAATGFTLPPAIDDADIRLVTGTLGRFPSFQRLGWEILNSGQVPKDGKRN